MSLMGMYNAYLMQSQQATIPEAVSKPAEITIDIIAKESPICSKIAEQLEVGFEELLITEHYRSVLEYIAGKLEIDFEGLLSADDYRDITPLIESVEILKKAYRTLENYTLKDYNFKKQNPQTFLLRHAANRIEENPDNYISMTASYFRDYYEPKIMRAFNKLKESVTANLDR